MSRYWVFTEQQLGHALESFVIDVGQHLPRDVPVEKLREEMSAVITTFLTSAACRDLGMLRGETAKAL